MSKPFYLASKDRWCIWIRRDGKRKRITLAKTEEEAKERWARMQAPPSTTTSWFVVASKFLEWSERRVKADETAQGTHDNYERAIIQFSRYAGNLDCSEIRQHHITDWVASNKGWGPAAERTAITAIKRAMNWAVEQGILEKNPIRSMKRPATRSRVITISRDQHAELVSIVDAGYKRKSRQFRWVLIGLSLTGCRPGELCSVRIEDSDGKTWTVTDHKKKRSDTKPRTVYLSPCAQALHKIVANGRTKGPLFRSTGGPLVYHALRCRFARLKEIAKDNDLIAYAYRHTWITNALLSGMDVATVAELAGTSIQMIQKHYGHLGSHKDKMLDAAAQYRPH